MAETKELLATEEEMKHTLCQLMKEKNSNSKLWYYISIQQCAPKIALGISVLVIGIISVFSTITPTADVYQSFGLFSGHYKHNIPYAIGISENTTRNHGFYNPQYSRTEEYPNNSVLYLTHSST